MHCVQDDAAEANWFPVTELPQLAFDHKQVIREALQKLSSRPQVQQTGEGDWEGLGTILLGYLVCSGQCTEVTWLVHSAHCGCCAHEQQ